MSITIYTKDYCPHCTAAKSLLTSKKLKFQEIDITHDAALVQQMLEKSNGQRTVPQIFIGSYHVGGNDKLQALNNSGELDNVLKMHYQH